MMPSSDSSDDEDYLISECDLGQPGQRRSMALMLIKAGCNVSLASLSSAIVCGHYHFMELFLADSERIPRGKWSYIQSRLEREDPTMLKRLLAVGAECPKLSIMCRRAFYDHYGTQARNQIESQPLPPGIKRSGQNVDQGRMMLASVCGVDELDSSGMTPLHNAAKEGRAELVSHLLSLGAKVDRLNLDGQTPLHLASEGTSLEVIKILVQAGADVNRRNRQWKTPLMYACQTGQCAISSFLLENGAEVNACSHFDKTPLLYAISSDALNVPLISELLKAKASVKDRFNGITALHAIITCESKEEKVKGDVLKLLLSYPCDVDAWDFYGSTPLKYAVEAEDEEAALMLIKAGCNVSLASMSSAITNGSFNFVELLLAAGERIPRGKWSYIESRLEREDPTMLKRLLAVGAECPKLSIMCRRAFYHHYGTQAPNQIENQPLPPGIKRYLSFEIL